MRHLCWILGLLVWLGAGPGPATAQDGGPPAAPMDQGQATPQPQPAAPAAPDQGAAQSQPAAPQTQAAPDQAAKAPDITAEAAAPIQAMCQLLKSRQAFTFTAEVSTEHVYPNGQTIQLTNTVEMALRRPDKLYARITGDDRDRVYVYDGKMVAVADLDRGVYATIDAPPNIDDTLNLLADKYGIDPPLADLLYSDPCQVLLGNVRTGDCVGVHTVEGKACDHLAFSQKESDWQMWVEKGKSPLPRKFVLNDKQVTGWPQFAATFTSWDLNPRLPANLFTFTPQKDAHRIDFMPLVSGQGQTK